MATQLQTTGFRGSKAVVSALGMGVVLLLTACSTGGGSLHQKDIDDTVKTIKNTTTFPNVVDEYTTFTDIKSEPNAVHYYFELEIENSSLVPQALLSQGLISELCDTPSTRGILDKNIHMKYTYTLTGSGEVYKFDYTKADCV